MIDCMSNQSAAPSPVDERITRALSRGHTIDITTTGRQSGQPRRITLVFHNIDGRIVISGMPGRRSWYANLLTDPRFTFHLTGPVKKDLPATARPIVEPVERPALMSRGRQKRGRSDHEVRRQHPPVGGETSAGAAGGGQ